MSGDVGAAPDDAPAITRVVVPLDGTKEAESAVAPALWVARSLNTPIELVTVYNAVRHTWAQQIDDVADRLNYENVEVVCVGSGWPGDVVVETVTEQPGTLLCMATHNRDQFSRLVLGSVTEHVIRTLHSPIMLIGPQFRPTGTPAHYRHILVCLTADGTDQTSLDIARTWARQLSLEIQLAHVISPSHRSSHQIEHDMTKIANSLNADGIPTTWTIQTADRPADGLKTLINERSDAIIALNSHRRVGLTRLVLGSISSELLETSPAPLLLTWQP